MSTLRIVVVPAEKGRYKILVNWIKFGIDYTTAALANQEALKVKEQHYPNANVVLAK